MKYTPRLARFAWPPTPLQGQYQWPGEAGSTVFLEQIVLATYAMGNQHMAQH